MKQNFEFNYYNKIFKISYIYQGDTTYLIMFNEKPLFYIDLDNFNIDIDTLETKEQENEIIQEIFYSIINNYVLHNEILKDLFEYEN